MLKRTFPYLRSADVLTILFLSFLCCLEAVFWQRLSEYLYYIPLNLVLIGFILYAGKKLSQSGKGKSLSLSIAFDWYLVPNILYVYTQASSLAHPLHGRDYDTILIAVFIPGGFE